MRKTLVVLLLFSLFIVTAAAEPVDTKLKTANIPVAVSAKDLPLDDLLVLLSHYCGVQILAVPEVAAIKVDLEIPAQYTLGQVLERLGEKYYLTYNMNSVKNAIIVHRGSIDDARGRSYIPGASIIYERTAKLSMPYPSPAISYSPPAHNTEEYKRIHDNGFKEVQSSPLSTFSIDVDTASYSNARRFLNSGKLPSPDAIRTEEMLNYFSYTYPEPAGEHPFSVTTEIGDCPWQAGNRLVLIGLQGKHMKADAMPPSNLVFLIDVSGSMEAPNKLPLLKTAFSLLVKQLREQDRVAIVVYAGAAGLALESTPGNEKAKILRAIESLEAGGSTAGGAGIKLAYQVAKDNFLANGNNRVILATDGDFNVGVSSEGGLTRMIEQRRNDGIYLSVLGFGMGNIKDNKMEALADKGNGNYAYIDNALEAKKVMVSQMAGTLFTIAKDVKLQVEFNPAKVKSYRLIGYENRALANEDFKDDKKDAGEMGAGHSVTALYEIVPASAGSQPLVDPLLYQRAEVIPSEELLHVKIRYKQPTAEASNQLTHAVRSQAKDEALSDNFRFAAAVAEYVMLLRDSEFKGQSSYGQILDMARASKGEDTEGYRAEFIRLVEISQILDEKHK